CISQSGLTGSLLSLIRAPEPISPTRDCARGSRRGLHTMAPAPPTKSIRNVWGHSCGQLSTRVRFGGPAKRVLATGDSILGGNPWLANCWDRLEWYDGVSHGLNRVMAGKSMTSMNRSHPTGADLLLY